jgi:hypothetical protein
MYRSSTFILTFILLFFTSCKKSSSNTTDSTKGDVVVGSYLEFSFNSTGQPTITSSATVSKVGTGQYKFTSNNSIPPFNFSYDALGTTLVGSFTGDLYYSIPKQVVNNISIDTSTSITFYNSARTLDFTLISKANNKTWRYSGTKQ